MATTDGLSIWHWLIVVIIVYVIYKLFKGGSARGNADGWGQRGVHVDYKSQTITIKGRKYSVFDVRGLRLIQGRVRIAVNDMDKPEYDIWAGAGTTEPTKFYRRLTMALEKAGAGPFTPY